MFPAWYTSKNKYKREWLDECNHRNYFKIKSYRQSLLLIHILESFKKLFTMAIKLHWKTHSRKGGSIIKHLSVPVSSSWLRKRIHGFWTQTSHLTFLGLGFLLLWNEYPELNEGLPQWLSGKVNLPAMWEMWVQSLGWEDSLEEEIAICSSILTWAVSRTEAWSCSPRGHRESDMTAQHCTA